jgi:hypothetical protein
MGGEEVSEVGGPNRNWRHREVSCDGRGACMNRGWPGGGQSGLRDVSDARRIGDF